MSQRIPYSATAYRNSRTRIPGVSHYRTTRILASGNENVMNAWEANFRIKGKMVKQRFYYGRDRPEQEALDLAIALRTGVVNAYRKGGPKAAEKFFREFRQNL